MTLQIHAHRWQSGALSDIALRTLVLCVGGCGGIQERLQRLGWRNELQVEPNRIGHSKCLSSRNEQLI
jgi:hypothetical protein